MNGLRAGLLGLLLVACAAVSPAEERWRDRDRDWHGRIEGPVIVFDVVRTHFERRPCERCEYRDGDSGGVGVFRIERRRYHEYHRGYVVRTWEETEEFFDHCEGFRPRFPY
jgi:hypothetical protein